ncbi:MAG: zf-HC2 domain-containing protein [Deltaproteobacteria bacterium]|nr:zf-HC2 domain-containing protein [Deltaproteobacteria bacterium]
MTCDVCRIDLSSHVDGVLGADERAALDEHLASCATCRGVFESLRAVKHAVGRLPSRDEPPGAVRARVEALRFSPPRIRRHRVAWSVAAGLVLAVGVSVTLMVTSRDTRIAPELADLLVADHLKSVPEAKPVEVASSDSRVIAKFFAGRTPFAPIVPALPGASLVGGRVCKIAGRHVELLFYRAHETTLSLFVSDQPLARADCRAAKSHTVCAATRGAHTLVLVGQRPRAELRALLDGASL